MESCNLGLKSQGLDDSKLENNGKWNMSNDLAIYLSKQLLWHALLISAPIILVALITGLLISVLQVITQIQDSTLSFVPKILAVVLMLMLCGEWMLHSLIEFAQSIIINIPRTIS
jgi:flagellar biosynthetic protein FliQ